MTVREAEAAEVRDMAERIVAGESLSSIARDLNARGVTTSGGKPFTSVEVRRIVQRGRNIARIEVETSKRPRRTTLGGPAQWPAILEEGLWQDACRILDDPERVTNGGTGTEPRWLLSKIALCGVCLADGHEVPVIVASGARGGQRTRVYACPNGKHMTRDAEQVDTYVGSVLAHWLARPEAAEVLASDPEVDPVAILAEVDRIGEQIEEARVMWTDGLLDTDQMRASVTDLRAREADLLASVGQGPTGTTLTVEDLRAGWDSLTIRQRRTLIRAFARVVLERSPKGRPVGWIPGTPYFRTDTVRVDLGSVAA
jgi:hypothetical protein